MSDKSVEIRTSDGIVLTVNEDTLSERNWRLLNKARKQQKKDQQNPGAVVENGFELVERPITRKEQRAEAVKIQKELEEMLKDQDLEFFMIICGWVVIGVILLIFFR